MTRHSTERTLYARTSRQQTSPTPLRQPALGRRNDVREPASSYYAGYTGQEGGSVAEWLACWTQAQKARVQIAAATLSGNSLRQTVHTHRASVHQAAKLVAGVTAGLAESNGSLPPGL